MTGKEWYWSKTIWFNVIALAGSVALAVGVGDARVAEVSAMVQGAVNIILRLVTTEPIVTGSNQ